MKVKSLIIYIIICFPIICAAQTVQVDNGYEKGLLVDGYKKGVWEYYDKEELKLKVDYNTSELVYLANDTSSYVIETEEGWEWSKLDIPPRYVGSMQEFFKIIYSNVKYPIKARERNIHGTVLIGFEVGLEGQIENVKILKDIGRGCGKEVLRVFNLIPNIWLVPKKDDKYYRARFILPVKFKIGTRTSRGDDFEKDSKKEMKALEKIKAEHSPANYIEEIIIAALKQVRVYRMN